MNGIKSGEINIHSKKIGIPESVSNTRNNSLALFYHQALPNMPLSQKEELAVLSENGKRPLTEVVSDFNSARQLLRSFRHWVRENPQLNQQGNWYDLDIVSTTQQFIKAKKEGNLLPEEAQLLCGAEGIEDAVGLEQIWKSWEEKGLPLDGLRKIFQGEINDPRSKIEQERQSGNPLTQGIIEAVANSVDAINGAKDSIGQFGIGVKQLLSFLESPSDNLYVLSKIKDDLSFHGIQLKRGANGKIFLHFLTSQELDSLHQERPKLFLQSESGTAITIQKERKSIDNEFAEEAKKKIRLHSFPFTEGVKIHLDGNLINNLEKKKRVIGTSHPSPPGKVDVLFEDKIIQIIDDGQGMNFETLSHMFSSYLGTKPKVELTQEQIEQEKEKLAVVVDTDLPNKLVSFTRNQRGIVVYEIPERLGLFEGAVGFEMGRLASIGYGWEGIVFDEVWEEGMRSILKKAAETESMILEDRIKTFNTVIAVVDKIAGEQQEDATNFILAQEIKKYGYTLFQENILPQIKNEGHTIIPNFREFSRIRTDSSKTFFIDPYLVDWQGKDFERLGCEGLKTESNNGYTIYSAPFTEDGVVKELDFNNPKAWLENTNHNGAMRFGNYIFVDNALTKRYTELIAKPLQERSLEETKKIEEVKQLLEIIINPVLITDYELEKQKYDVRLSTEAEKYHVDSLDYSLSAKIPEDDRWKDFLGGEKSSKLINIKPDFDKSKDERFKNVRLTQDGRIIAFDQLRSCFYSSNTKQSHWERHDNFGWDYLSEVFSPNENTFIAINCIGIIKYSVDNGENWIKGGLISHMGQQDLSSKMLRNGEIIIYDNNGRFHDLKKLGLRDFAPADEKGLITDFDLIYLEDQDTLLANSSSGIWSSNDHGKSWKELDASKAEKRTILQLRNGTLFRWDEFVENSSSQSKVYKSKDGELWQNISLNHEFLPYIKEADFTSNDEIIVRTHNQANGEDKLLFSKDQGETWQAINLPSGFVHWDKEGWRYRSRRIASLTDGRIVVFSDYKTIDILGLDRKNYETIDLKSVINTGYGSIFNLDPNGVIFVSNSDPDDDSLYRIADSDRYEAMQKIRPGLINHSKQAAKVLHEKFSQIPGFDARETDLEYFIKMRLEPYVNEALDQNPKLISAKSEFLPDYLIELLQGLVPNSPFMKNLSRLQADLRDMDKEEEGILGSVGRFTGKIFRKQSKQDLTPVKSEIGHRLTTVASNLISLIQETEGKIDINSLNLEALSMILTEDRFGDANIKEAYQLTDELLRFINSRKDTRLSYKAKDLIIEKLGLYCRKSTPDLRRTFLDQFLKCKDPKVYQKVTQSLQKINLREFERMINGEFSAIAQEVFIPNMGIVPLIEASETTPLDYQTTAYVSFIINRTEVLPAHEPLNLQEEVTFNGELPLEVINYLFTVYKPSSMEELLSLYSSKREEIAGLDLEQLRLRIIKEITGQANEPGVWTREAVQNSVKAIRSRNREGLSKADEGRIEIMNFVEEEKGTGEKSYVEEIRDNGSGVPDYLYILIPGLSTAGSGQEQIGYFGAGFFTLFDGADKVQVITNNGEKNMMIEMEMTKDNNNISHIVLKRLSNIRKAEGRKLVQGTTVRRIKKINSESLSELENMVTKSNFNMFAGLVSGKSLDGVSMNIYFGKEDKGRVSYEKVDLQAKEESSTPLNINGMRYGNLRLVSCKKSQSQVATNLGLRMSGFNKKYYELIPPQIRGLIDEYSLSVLMPEALSLTKDRSSIAHENEFLEPLQIEISQEIMKLAARKILEDNIRIEGYPEDYLSNMQYAFSYQSSSGKRIQEMAKKINNGNRILREDLEFIFGNENETDQESKLAKLIVLLEFQTGKGGKTSLLLERLKVQKQAGLLQQEEIDSHEVLGDQIEKPSSLSSSVVSQLIEQASNIADAYASLRNLDEVEEDKMSAKEKDFILNVRPYAQLLRITNVKLSRTLQAAGKFDGSDTAYLSAKLADYSTSDSTDAIVHELAHDLEAKMENKAFIGHDTEFTHQTDGVFAESMRFVAQLALRNSAYKYF